MLSVNQLAKHLSVCTSTVYRNAKSLGGFKVGGPRCLRSSPPTARPFAGTLLPWASRARTR